jgi:hypothetical protein
MRGSTDGQPRRHALTAPRRKWPLRVAIGVVVLLALLIGADRISLVVAEHEAATAFQQSQHLADTPSVSVGGFPFLTQLAAGEFDDVTVAVRDLSVGAATRTLLIQRLDVDLQHVTLSDGFHTVHARLVTADAHVGFADLSKTLGVTVAYAGTGRIQAVEHVTVAGVAISGTVSAAVHASATDGLSFDSLQVQVDGQSVPAAVTKELDSVFARPIPLGDLPFGVQVRGVDTGSSGIVVHLLGTNMVYQRS